MAAASAAAAALNAAAAAARLPRHHNVDVARSVCGAGSEIESAVRRHLKDEVHLANGPERTFIPLECRTCNTVQYLAFVYNAKL